jgi:site-specific DNA recombinase
MATAAHHEPAEMNAIYARLSRAKRDDDLNVEGQIELATDWLVARGVDPDTIVVFVDNGRTASRFATKPRTDFVRLSEHLTARTVKSITVVEIERMWRKPREVEDFIDVVDATPKDHRVRFNCISDDSEIVLNAAGRQMLRRRVTDAAAESDKISERVLRRSGLHRKRGSAHGGARPFGYERVWSFDERKHPVPSLQIVESEAQLIRSAVDLVLADASINDVTRQWIAAGVKTALGNQWTPCAILALLRSPRIAGLVPRDDKPVGTASWAPIVDVETWERLQERIRARSYLRPQRRRSLMSGVLVCGGTFPDGRPCGFTLEAHYRKGKCYRVCSARPGRPACGQVAVSEHNVLDLVTEALFYLVDRLDFADLVARFDADRGTSTALLDEANTVRSEIDAIPDAVAAGLSVATATAIEAKLIARLTALRERLAKSLDSSPLEPYIGRPGVLRAAWTALTDDQRRTFILAVFGQIAILPVGHSGPRFHTERVVLASRFTVAAETA